MGHNASSPSGKAHDFDSCIRWFDSTRGSSKQSEEGRVINVNDSGATKLVTGIILFAATDLARANKILENGKQKKRINGNMYKLEEMRQECLDFFRSPWFQAICDLDGEMIIKEIEKNGRKTGMSILPDRW